MSTTKRIFKKTSFTESDATEVVLEKKSFNTEDFRTSIFLLSTKDHDTLLKAIGTLSRYATNDARFLEKYIEGGIYPKLVKLLENKNVVILKFTLKLLAMLANDKFISMVEYMNVLMCSELVTRYFIESKDNFVQECCSFILLTYVKYSEIITNQIYSDQLLEAIFHIFLKSIDLDILCNSLNLFYYLLDVEIAKDDMTRNNVFSSKILVCLLECEEVGVKDVVMDILLKLSGWRTRNICLLLTKENVLRAMVQLLLKGDKGASAKAFDILQNCISNEESAVEFSNTKEFSEFIHWLRICSNTCLLRSLPIICILTKIPELRQKLYDLSFDVTFLSWLKYRHEEVILYLLQIINNLSEHKLFCETFTKFALVKTIKELILKENLLQIHGELSLTTLRNLLVRSPKTMDYLIGCNGVVLILDLFTDHQEELTSQGYQKVLDILHYFATSKYSPDVFTDKIYQKLLELYKDDRDMRLRILRFFNILSKDENFRNFLINFDGIDELLRGMKEEKTCLGTQLHLEIISNLVKYQELVYKFLDLDLLPFLKTIRPKIKLTVIEDILMDLYDYCLTLKFAEMGRLEVENKIDYRFYLFQEDLPESSVVSLNVVSSKKPVYVVSVMLVKITSERELTSSENVLSSIRISNKKSSSNKRVVSTNLNFSQNILKLNAVYEHGEIPKDVLLYRCTNSDSNYYQDYYLERYILTLLRELYFSDNAPTTLTSRIRHIAEYVDRQLSGILTNLTEAEKRVVFQKHLENLKTSIGMNVIPIGYLRMGYQRERALLFKVLCDNLCVPVTLCKKNGDIYWNEVSLIVKYESNSYVREEQIVYVVDLMSNIGELMPLTSIEAQEYLSASKTSISLLNA